MARNYAQVRCNIWHDPDFAALSPGAQRMYLMILSQPKLSICGVVDYLPERWARLGRGMTAGDVEHLVCELAAARFVLLDLDHAEVAVRSFVKHDGFAGRWQMVSAMWAAWEAVSSPALKEALVREMPDEVWSHDKAKAPAMAMAIRLAIADPMPTPAPTPAPTPGAPIDFGTLRAALR